MNVGRRRRWIYSILLLAAASVLYAPVTHLITAGKLLVSLRTLSTGAAGQELAVDQLKVQRRFAGRDLDAILYVPRGVRASRAIVLVPGISELGYRHPRLVSLARYWADNGFLILTPDVAMFRRFEFSADPIEEIAYWYRELSRLPQSQGTRRIGLAGISFSGTLALITAARPEIRESVAFVLAIGPYCDLLRCSREWFAADHASFLEGHYPTRFYAKWIMMIAALPLLPDAVDRRCLRDVLEALLLQKEATPPPDARMTGEGRRWLRLAIMPENESDTELTARIVDYVSKGLYEGLNPERSAAEVRCPVFLVHGAFDDLIPPRESLDLKGRLRNTQTHVLITPFLTHTHPAEAQGWAQQVKASSQALRFLYAFARAAS